MTVRPGTLYVVATPIGNLDDLSKRAREVLDTVAVVACEDTRRTGQLLTHLGIQQSLLSLHEHNEAQRTEQLLSKDHQQGLSEAEKTELKQLFLMRHPKRDQAR